MTFVLIVSAFPRSWGSAPEANERFSQYIRRNRGKQSWPYWTGITIIVCNVLGYKLLNSMAYIHWYEGSSEVTEISLFYKNFEYLKVLHYISFKVDSFGSL